MGCRKMDRSETASEIDEKAFGWVARLDRDSGDPTILSELNDWLAADPRHEGAYLRAQALWLRLDRASQADLPPRPILTRRRLLFAAGGVAALAASGAALWLDIQPDLAFDSALGEIRQVPLADGSTAQLNSASQVQVAMKRSERRIKVAKGEAWFQVEHDSERPFIVESGPVRVRAIGTAFSVRKLEQGGSEVQVTEGVVKAWITGEEAEAVRLEAGQRAILQEHMAPVLIPASANEIERRLAWRARKIDLDGETLAEAVSEFNRYNRKPVVIRQRALAGKRFYGVFRIDDPEGFARAVHLSLNAPIRIDETVIEIGK